MIKNTNENMEKLKEYLQSRRDDELDIVDLIKFIANKYGANLKTDIKKDKVFEKIITLDKNTIVILVDGLGFYKVKDLNESSVLKRGLKTSLQTVNPTSTACVLTSLVSASYPSEHGIFGWWQYSKKHDINYYPLLFSDKKGINLKEKNINANEIFKIKSIFDTLNVDTNIYMNRKLINSDYSKIFNGEKSNKYGTYSIRDAFNKIVKKIVENKSKKSFSYLYIDGLDIASHVYGTKSKEVQNIIDEIERGIINIKKTDENVTMIVIADHGQVDMTSMIYLNQNNDYTKYFYAIPSIDTRMISFFVKEEYKEEFETKFSEEFSEDIILLKKEEVEKYKLFGNENFTENANNSCGEYIGIVVNNKFMVCDKITLEDKMSTKGNHSGLTKDETTIPLIVV